LLIEREMGEATRENAFDAPGPLRRSRAHALRASSRPLRAPDTLLALGLAGRRALVEPSQERRQLARLEARERSDEDRSRLFRSTCTCERMRVGRDDLGVLAFRRVRRAEPG